MNERQYLSQKTQIMRPIPIVVASRASVGDNRQSAAVLDILDRIYRMGGLGAAASNQQPATSNQQSAVSKGNIGVLCDANATQN